MAIPRISRRRLRSLVMVVASCAVGLGADGGPVERLIEQLRAGDARARSQAALRLGLLGPRAASAIGPLDSALNDPDPRVRANAMYSLVRLGSRSPRLLPILAEQIEATPEPKRWQWRVSVTSRFAAPAKGWTLSDGGLFDNDPIAALKRIRPDASAFVPMLEKALKPQDRRAREAALAQAGRTRSPGVPTNTREDFVRAAAIEALCEMAAWSDPSSPELAGALLAAMADDRFDPAIDRWEALGEFHERRQVVDALARLDRAARERAEAQLAVELRGLGSARSYEAEVLLGRLPGGTSTVVSILRDVLRDGDDLRRRIAMIMLGPIAGPAEIPAVIRAMTAPGAERPINLNLDWWDSVGGRGRGGYRISIGEGHRSLIEFGVQTLKAMGASVERRSIREFMAMARKPDGDPDRRRRAIIALGEFGPSAAGAVPLLAEVIRAGQEADRRASRRFAARDSAEALATEALGKIAAEGQPEALAVLAGLIETPGWTVGPDAASELARLGPKAKPAVPALRKALSDPRQSVRFEARRALDSIGGP